MTQTEIADHARRIWDSFSEDEEAAFRARVASKPNKIEFLGRRPPVESYYLVDIFVELRRLALGD